MPFHFGNEIKNFLFQGWNSSSTADLMKICAFVFGLTLLMEGLKVLRAFLKMRANLNPLTYAKTENNVNERSQLIRPLIIPPSVSYIKRRKLCYHVAESMLNITSLVLGYLVMLAVMSYNSYVGISIIIGTALGYFIFAAIQRTYVDIIPAENEEQSRKLSATGYGSLKPKEI